MLMVQGDLAGVTLTHVAIATKTGLLAVSPAVGLTFTPYVRHLRNRWAAAAFLAACTFAADAALHESHYPGAYTEAALTAFGAFAVSVLVSYTPLGQRLDGLVEHFQLTKTGTHS
jgi:hypothetical protein